MNTQECFISSWFPFLWCHYPRHIACQSKIISFPDLTSFFTIFDRIAGISISMSWPRRIYMKYRCVFNSSKANPITLQMPCSHFPPSYILPPSQASLESLKTFTQCACLLPRGGLLVTNTKCLENVELIFSNIWSFYFITSY